VAARDSQLEVRALEIRKLAAVVERNLARVEAETAIAHGQTARETSTRRPAP
jgi:hypothetical protein